MTDRKQIPRWLIVLLIALDVVGVLVLLVLLTWITWHDGRMEETPSEYRPLLTWLIYAIPLAAVSFLVFGSLMYVQGWKVRPREWKPDA